MTRADRENRLEGLIRANASDVLAYLERRIDARADAADILSETLIVAWKKAGRAPIDEIDGRMWLFAIARNALLNARRAARRRLAATERLRSELEHSPAKLGEDVLDAIAVRRAVQQLPHELGELVELVHWEGFSVVEAAQVMGISASTARSRYMSAKGRLRAALVAASEDANRR